jgi:hypothetical protein
MARTLLRLVLFLSHLRATLLNREILRYSNAVLRSVILQDMQQDITAVSGFLTSSRDV